MSLLDLPPGDLLFCFDLDGTLISDGGSQVPESTAQVLEKLRSLGASFVIITGRNTVPAAVLDVVKPEAVATNNGARLKFGDLPTREIYFSEDELQLLATHGLDGASLLYFSSDGQGGGMGYVDFPSGEAPLGWMKEEGYTPVSQLTDHTRLSKVILHHTEADELAVLAQRWRQHTAGLVVTGAQNPYPNYLTVTPPASDKGNALEKIAAELGVSLSLTVVFGDSDNDLEMLERAGWAVQVGQLPLLERVTKDRIESPEVLGRYLSRWLPSS